jgi:hypothetical protein
MMITNSTPITCGANDFPKPHEDHASNDQVIEEDEKLV